MTEKTESQKTFEFPSEELDVSPTLLPIQDKVQLLSNGADIISTWVFNTRTPWWASPFLGGSSELCPVLDKWVLPGTF